MIWMCGRASGRDGGVVSGPCVSCLMLVIIAMAIGALFASEAVAAEADEMKTTIGRLEKVWIQDVGIVLDAKIDTGTLTSSLHVRDLAIFTKESAVWARFVIEHPNGEPIALERLVTRFARFKKQGQEVDRRPIVMLGLCIGDIFRRTEVNLTDRKRFTYPALIGRRFLSGNAIVDTEKKFTSPPRCAEMKKER
jgi:hypothetical protein